MAPHDPIEANPFAAPETDLTTPDEQWSSGKLVYATFWQRFVAAFVDNILMQILGAIGGGVIGAILGATGNQQFAPLAGGLIGLLVGWFYCALQESSESKATLGKKMMGLKVVDLSGGQISFGRATGRHFGKILSAIILLVGYLMQPFTEKKQALHDILAGTLVIKG